ncbi:MAG: hypothetical protein AAGF95_23735 [Chloroflexota bacterium]
MQITVNWASGRTWHHNLGWSLLGGGVAGGVGGGIGWWWGQSQQQIHRPVLSQLRALRDAGITKAERRSIITQSRGLFDIDTIQPLPLGNNIALGPYTSGIVKPAGSDYVFMSIGSSQAESYLIIQANQLNARLLNEPQYGVIEAVTPELQKADAILFFTKSGMVGNHYLTTEELRYVLDNDDILQKTSFVTGFFP